MGIQVCVIWLLVLMTIAPTGSDWLTCGNIPGCNCKWSSGKKTASCSSLGLKTPPELESDIQVLDLHGNPLETLGKDAFLRVNMINLQKVNLSSTCLRTLHSNAFNHLRILIELDLSQNELSQLSPDLFKATERLRVLILNDNPLTTLVAEQFPPLRYLKKLEISRCKLRSVSSFAFTNLRALESVNIQQNYLTHLHQSTFNLPLMNTLSLSDNPWHCDCGLREFHDWFVSSNLGNEEVLCLGPESKANLSWSALKREDFFCSPSVLTSPTVIRTEVGADISFGCFVRGDPKPVVTWSLNRADVFNNIENGEITIHRYDIDNFNEYTDYYLNKSSQWVNISISNITNDLAGEWKCSAKSSVGDASTYLTILLPKARTARTATARVVPDYSAFFLIAGSMLAMTAAGFVSAYICWKTRRRRIPPSRSFTDQEKKLLDSSLAASCDRASGDMSLSYGFEMLDRSMSLDSEDNRCLEPVQITVEGPPGSFPPPPAEFALPAPYGNIFISVQVSGHNDEYPDLLGGGTTLPRRNTTCFLKSTYDNMGPRITAAGSSTWSLPGANDKNTVKENLLTTPLSNFSTEFTAL
ncbi:leucine-rich repeat-containing protein 24-like [Bombyx mandarina]|uniref:Leucine-rich repeat-containing protein 24-like n=1 Tax=Bombyx mandarina TaxID=7092 RepID=A0A6J2JGE8_BOMMA|nr:leucine-rich repeat-containing protein 24-like [Bombyx mandarina]